MTSHPALRRSGALLVMAILAVGLGGCGSSAAPSVAGMAPPSAGTAFGTPTTTEAPPTGGTPAPTAPLVAGLANPMALVPADPGEGPVPAAEEPAPAVTGTLDLGAVVDLGGGTADANGGTITVSAPGDPLDGLAIDVPPGTYDASVRFAVSERPIAGSSFGAAGITPITPLLTVTNGGVVATGDPVTVRFPATIPAGASATAFYYEARTGAISPLTVVEQGATSVTVATTHFSDLFLGLLDWAKLPETVDSGFRPGVDDWEFTNYGSYVAPGGHCEGQSVSAIWYYVNERRGARAKALYGLYDDNGAPPRTPGLWEDDSLAYRFASAVQHDPIALPKTYKAFNRLSTASGTLQYQMFRAAIAVTGEPQLIAIAASNGDHGHAMVVYRVSPNRLYVADPNYPARLRTIKYDAATGKLGPYNSGANAASIAAGDGVVYTRFAFIPAWASASDAAIGRHWAELQDKTSGNGIFPAYTLEAWKGVDEDGKDIWVPLDDGYTTPDPKLRVRLVTPSEGDQATMAVYRDADEEPSVGWGTDLTVDLEEGSNELGFHELGAVGGQWAYVNFVRLTVTKGEIDINGRWDGTVTFNEVQVDQAAKSTAEDQGCSAEMIEALKGKALPMTIEFAVDNEGKGTAQMTVDTSALLETTSEPEAQTLQVTYTRDVIAFELGDSCDASSCGMTGKVSQQDGVDTIDGTLTLKGDGYSAAAAWSVTRLPEP